MPSSGTSSSASIMSGCSPPLAQCGADDELVHQPNLSLVTAHSMIESLPMIHIYTKVESPCATRHGSIIPSEPITIW